MYDLNEVYRSVIRSRILAKAIPADDMSSTKIHQLLRSAVGESFGR
jgi:hypothetical protein